MPSRPTNARVQTLAFSACALAGAALALSACSDSAPNPPAAQSHTQSHTSAPGLPEGDPQQTYPNVRAVVVAMPQGTRPMQLHHEAIPTFIAPATGEIHKNPDGTEGMKEMTMPMPLAPGVSLDGIEVGDKVEFTLAVWSSPKIDYRVTALTELPADAEVDITQPASP